MPLLVAGRDDSPIPVADDHHASLPHTRCLIDAQRLRTSKMGCSRCMALGSTRQGACPRSVIAPRLKHTTPHTRAALLAVWACVADDHHASLPLDARSMH